MKQFALLRENFRISLTSIKTNTLRTVLTVLIIAVGIMALVGILTAIDSLKGSISNTFSDMGANTFSIQSYGSNFQVLTKRVRKKSYSYITYRQAEAFKEQFSIPSNISIGTWVSGVATVKAGNAQTNPNVAIEGGDEGYLIANGLEIDKGRLFSDFELEIGDNVGIVGTELVSKLFKGKKNVLGEYVNVAGIRYKIIGIFKSKGGGFGNSVDRRIVIPVNNARVNFSRPNQSFYINITPDNPLQRDIAVSEAEGLFRQIRRVYPGDESDFNVEQSDSIAKIMLEQMGYANAAAIFIGFITMLGAAIGLMNIMLVAVSERTREIGTRKAIGATSGTIKQQFLFESILIGQLGGILGIILGILIGNILPLMMGAKITIPWLWMLVGVTVCFIVSVASGYIPAVKAAKLDPIESLRYE